MRPKIVTLICILVLVFMCQREKNLKSHTSDPVRIPDAVFLYSMISGGIDTNMDSIISYGEVEVVTVLTSGETCWVRIAASTSNSLSRFNCSKIFLMTIS